MKKKFKVLLATTLILSTISINTYAYSIVFGSMKFAFTNQYDLTLSYRQGGAINHSTAVYNGRTAWNNSPAHVFVSYASPGTGNIVVDSSDYGNTGWHGLCQPPIVLAPDTSFIKINDYYYYSFINNSSELVSHEMGHSFRLNDISNTAVLMRNSGYKGSSNPEQDDIDGVNSTYK